MCPGFFCHCPVNSFFIFNSSSRNSPVTRAQLGCHDVFAHRSQATSFTFHGDRVTVRSPRFRVPARVPQDGADHVSGDRSTAFIIGPYVKQGSVVSNFYTTVSMVRTMEEVLGTSQLSVHDAGVPPMTAAFDTTQTCNPITGGGVSCWTYSAFPAEILFNTQLPLLNKFAKNRCNLPQSTHSAAWWAAKTKGMDFSEEDLNDPAAFNRIIWEGMMGGKPYPTARSGAVMRHSGTPQPETRQVGAAGGSK